MRLAQPAVGTVILFSITVLLVATTRMDLLDLSFRCAVLELPLPTNAEEGQEGLLPFYAQCGEVRAHGRLALRACLLSPSGRDYVEGLWLGTQGQTRPALEALERSYASTGRDLTAAWRNCQGKDLVGGERRSTEPVG
jgi:hypothetical protein